MICLDINMHLMVVNGRFIVVVLWTIENPKPLVDNQSDIFSHFLDMSCNEQVATNDHNGQVFFFF